MLLAVASAYPQGIYEVLRLDGGRVLQAITAGVTV